MKYSVKPILKWPFPEILGMQKFWVVTPKLTKEEQDKLTEKLENTVKDFLEANNE